MDRNRQSSLPAIISTVIAVLCATTQAKTLYVDDDAPPGGNGSSWASAFTYLQDALTAAQAGDEIRVAQGVYRPDRSLAHPDGTGDRGESFCLLDGVAIRGGYAGVGEADPNARDVVMYATILSGDLAGDDVPVADPCDMLNEPTRNENAHNIVTAESCGRSAVLDGFTITSATSGALFLPEKVRPCRPSVSNCTFVSNTAGAGAAVYINEGIEPELIDCTFLLNVAQQEGGALTAVLGRSPHLEADGFVVKRCIFAWNSAVGTANDTPATGGAIRIRYGSPSIIEDCTFLKNTAGIGGAVHSGRAENIVNCRFIENAAYTAGGAIYFNGSELNIKSCTFFGNVAPNVQACYAGGQSALLITSAILWDGGDEIGVAGDSSVSVTYSDIQGGWPGEGNIDADPLFADPGLQDPNDGSLMAGDYHLKSQAGRWDPNSQSWVMDDVTSPCIDAGDPNSPVGEEPEPNGGGINMGAYGGTGEASKSPAGGG